MRTDAYYHSPVNPLNPVIVWTDGRQLFFAPAESQVASGRTTAAPEAAFSPPPAYLPEQIRWDTYGSTGSVAALQILARKSGAPDVEVAVTNTLEQSAQFLVPPEEPAETDVSREGTEFLESNLRKVPKELSGASQTAAIQQEHFPEGFFRYRALRGSHDLYVGQGADPAAHLVERSTGAIVRKFAAGSIAAVVAEPGGVVRIELSPVRGAGARHTLIVDLRASPAAITTAAEGALARTGYGAAKNRLQKLGVDFEEVGLRLTHSELEAIEGSLTPRAMSALNRVRVRGKPLLLVRKSIGTGGNRGGFLEDEGAILFLTRHFKTSTAQDVATVRHEMTHLVVTAIKKAEAREARDKKLDELARVAEVAEAVGLIRAGERGVADPSRPTALTRALEAVGLIRAGRRGSGASAQAAVEADYWKNTLVGDLELASTWVELLRNFPFVPDPEGLQEHRGVSLADESRYSKSRANAGHPAESLDEFIASLVTSATVFHGAFVAAVLSAERAGNRMGVGRGSQLRRLYRVAWKRIDDRYVQLGRNPF